MLVTAVSHCPAPSLSTSPHTALGVQTGPSSRFLNPEESHARAQEEPSREDGEHTPRPTGEVLLWSAGNADREGHVLLHWTYFTFSSDETLMHFSH